MKLSTVCTSSVSVSVTILFFFWQWGVISIDDYAVVAEKGSVFQRSATPTPTPPFIPPKMLMQNKLITQFDNSDGDGDGVEKETTTTTTLVDVISCCSVPDDDDEEEEANSNSNSNNSSPQLRRPMIGKMPQMSEEQTLQVLQDAETAWDGGAGAWPQLPLRERITAIEQLLTELESNQRTIMIQALMWEIGKNQKDAEAEFDRTMAFGRSVIAVVRGLNDDNEFAGSWKKYGATVRAYLKRAAIGIVLCLGPMNYPLNETYATLLPALLMGNVVVMKIPSVGGLVHLLTMEAFQKYTPGALHFVSGRGRETMPTLMKTGKIDSLAFIGGSAAADALIRHHPSPHRLKIFLQLEAKNMGIFLPNLFEKCDDNSRVKEEELATALDQAVLGALSFNGQRCTSLKIFFIPQGHGLEFSRQMAKRIDNMHTGLPWQLWNDNDTNDDDEDDTTKPHYSHFTPLPSKSRIELMRRLIDDAVSKGATIVNKQGGEILGDNDSTLMVPAVLYPVTPDMDIYYEEQFGPIVPITEYDTLDTVFQYGQDGKYGQQVSIFVSESEEEETVQAAAQLVDRFSTVFGKININSQCGRSPDTVPFSGRRSSAMGVMSVTEALREFSIPTVVSYPTNNNNNNSNQRILQQIAATSTFLQPL